MTDHEYYAMKVLELHEQTSFRRADLMGPFDKELELERNRERGGRRTPVRWAGAGMTALGRRLTAVGERLAPPQHDAKPIA